MKRARRARSAASANPEASQKLPAGWDAEAIRALAEYYDHQSDEEAIAEADAALEAEEGGRDSLRSGSR